MTKEEKLRLLARGKIILRAQHDGRGVWRIVNATAVGGWTRLSPVKYFDRESCENDIETICAVDPKYVWEERP